MSGVTGAASPTPLTAQLTSASVSLTVTQWVAWLTRRALMCSVTENVCASLLTAPRTCANVILLLPLEWIRHVTNVTSQAISPFPVKIIKPSSQVSDGFQVEVRQKTWPFSVIQLPSSNKLQPLPVLYSLPGPLTYFG